MIGVIALPIVERVHRHVQEQKKRQQNMVVLVVLGMQQRHEIATYTIVQVLGIRLIMMSILYPPQHYFIIGRFGK